MELKCRKKAFFLFSLYSWAVVLALGNGVLAGAEEIPVLEDRLPSFPLTCELTGEEGRPDAVLRGKPAVLYFTDTRRGTAGELVRFLAEMQAEYAPWLTWAVVLVGPAGPDEIRKLHAESPVRFNRCFSDRSGEWRAAFRLQDLPAAVLITDEGYVLRRQYGFRAEDKLLLTREVERLVQAGKLIGRPAEDFTLPEIGTGRLKTLADVAQRDYTILFSLRNDCAECFEELKILQRYRDDNPERVVLVAIYHDADVASPTAPVAREALLHPDHAVSDRNGNYADRYFVAGLPFLLVIDPEGKIALARKGFSRDITTAFPQEMAHLISREAAPGTKTNDFAALRRIRAEGLEFLAQGQYGMAALFLERALELNPGFFTLQPLLAEAYAGVGKRREAAMAYTRYLAAEPKACDREKIEEQIGLLKILP